MIRSHEMTPTRFRHSYLQDYISAPRGRWSPKFLAAYRNCDWFAELIYFRQAVPIPAPSHLAANTRAAIEVMTAPILCSAPRKLDFRAAIPMLAALTKGPFLVERPAFKREIGRDRIAA